MHQAVASGSGQTSVPMGGPGSLTVQLSSPSGDLAVIQPPLDSGTDLGVSVDALPTEPALTPGLYSFGPSLVGRSSSLTLTFFNPKSQDVVISAVDAIPAGPPFAIDPSGTCAPAQAVAPGQSCTVVVKFAPEQRGMVSADARVSFGVNGEADAFLDGLGVAWLSEGLAQDAGVVPTFYSLWGTALDDAWAGGDHSTLLHLTQNGWMKVAPPASATTVSAIWGSGVNDLWVGSNLTKELDHTVNGTTWTPTTLASTGNVLSLWGEIDLYATTSTGEIFHYSGSNWNPERSPDNNSLQALWGSSNSDVWAAGSQILHRDPGSTWSALAATAVTGDHNAIWGSSAGDIWIAGCDLSGTTCGFLKHLQNGNFQRVDAPKTDALLGLWGSSQKDIFAVGKGGAILHYDGSTWTTEASSTTVDLRAVWGASGEVFAVGAGGTILHRY
jgi:hypothetical protein